MSTIESTGPGGVSKRYGPLDTGGMVGSIRANDAEVEVVFQLQNGEDAGSNLATVSIPAYSRVENVYVVVDEAYAASSTVDAQLDGTSVLGAAASLAALASLKPALSSTDADLTVGATAEDLTVVVNANGLASTTGTAKVVVQYVRA